MKRFSSVFLLTLLFTSPLLLFSQSGSPSRTVGGHIHDEELTCGTIATPEVVQRLDSQLEEIHRVEEEFMQRYYQKSGGGAVEWIPIKAHIVRTSAGTGGLAVADLNAAIDSMNAFYINAQMQFYLCDGINYIDDDTYYNFDASEEAALTGANNVANLINIYFCDVVTNGASNLCGYAYFPGGPDVIMMKNSCAINGSTLPHEMGHFFSLYHTHGTSNGTLTDELVDGTNCTTAGDRVCDTEADPQLGNSNVSAACVYNGTAPYTGGVTVDLNGDSFVPNPNNIMSYSRKSCRDFFSPGQYARIYAAYTTQRNYFTCGTFDVDFSANPTTACSAPVTVNFTNASVGATNYYWDVDNNGTVDYTTANPSHTYTVAGNYTVCLRITNGTDTISKTYVDMIGVGAQSLPFTEDFETFDVAANATGLKNGWTTSPANTTSAYRWNPDENGTPSSNTGPLVDNTLGTAAGNYMFTEASGYAAGDVAELITPCIDLGVANPEITFAYHMFGGNMGELHLDIDAGGGWVNDIMTAYTGQQHAAQGDPWSTATVNLAAYAGSTVQFRFRGVRGNGFTSDMAVDDINIQNNAALDATILTFHGEKTDYNTNLLHWTTEREVNLDRFEVQRSADGVHFSHAGATDALGKLNGGSYSFADVSDANRETAYYRLKMLDANGTESYSSVIRIGGAGSDISELTVFPNPFADQVNLRFSHYGTLSGSYPVEILNGMGQRVMIHEMEIGFGTHDMALDLSGLESGVYWIRLSAGNEVYVKAVVKR